MNTNILNLEATDIVQILTKSKSEQELMSNWKGEITRPLVSIVCHTFNHVNYITSALDGFLMQETDFPFEIILHDDASTDGTREIVESYARKYPNIIVPIIQNENKYSKGIDILSITLPKSRGDYISFCEGDDFWICSNKISYQYYEMEKNKEAYICFHSGLELNEDSKEKKIISQYANDICFIPSKKIIIDRGGSMPTASIFFKNESIDEMLMSYQFAPIGDFFIQSYMALKGKVLFLPETMCVYRRNAAGSWTSSQVDKDKQIEYYKKMIKSIDNFYGKLKKNNDSKVLVTPLCFYLKGYLMGYRNPFIITKICYGQIASLKYFNKVDVTVHLLQSIAPLFLNKLKKVNRLRVKK